MQVQWQGDSLSTLGLRPRTVDAKPTEENEDKDKSKSSDTGNRSDGVTNTDRNKKDKVKTVDDDGQKTKQPGKVTYHIGSDEATDDIVSSAPDYDKMALDGHDAAKFSLSADHEDEIYYAILSIKLPEAIDRMAQIAEWVAESYNLHKILPSPLKHRIKDLLKELGWNDLTVAELRDKFDKEWEALSDPGTRLKKFSGLPFIRKAKSVIQYKKMGIPDENTEQTTKNPPRTKVTPAKIGSPTPTKGEKK